MQVHQYAKKAAFTSVMTMGLLIGIELGFRGFIGVFSEPWSEAVDNYRAEWLPEMQPSMVFRPHPYVGYVNSSAAGQAGVNDDGFYGPEIKREKKTRQFRIACMGGSTTAGPRSWPFQLEQMLQQAGGSYRYQVINYGVGGWTSAESMINFVHHGQSYSPDLVIIHHTVNDLPPIQRDDYRPDYLHYRVAMNVSEDEQGRTMVRNNVKWGVDTTLGRASSLYVALRLLLIGNQRSVYSLDNITTTQGAHNPNPPDGNADGYRRNLTTIALVAESVGAKTVLTTIPYDQQASGNSMWKDGMVRQGDRLRRLAEDEGMPFVDLAAMMADGQGFAYQDPVHVDEAGDVLKAELLYAALKEQGLLPAR